MYNFVYSTFSIMDCLAAVRPVGLMSVGLSCLSRLSVFFKLNSEMFSKKCRHGTGERLVSSICTDRTNFKMLKAYRTNECLKIYLLLRQIGHYMERKPSEQNICQNHQTGNYKITKLQNSELTNYHVLIILKIIKRITKKEEEKM